MSVRLTEPQTNVFSSLARFRIWVAARRAGKTTLAGVELIRAALTGKPKRCAYIAPTWRQAKDDAWRNIKDLTKNFWMLKPNETNMQIDLMGGSQIILRGATNFESLRGGNYGFVVMDEFADIDPEAWTAVIRPKLADTMGRALFIGTPKIGSNPAFKEMYDRCIEPEYSSTWARFTTTTAEGGWVSAQELEQSMREMDPRTFRQEFLASFETLEGGVYYAFKKEIHAARELQFDSRIPLLISMDFNINPMCAIIGQMHTENLADPRIYLNSNNQPRKIFHILDEIYLNNSNTMESCLEFIRKTTPYFKTYGLSQIDVNVYGDSSGSQRSTAGAGALSDWETVRQVFMSHPEYRMNYKYKRSNPSIRDRVSAVNSKLKNVKGEITLFIDPRCKKLIADLISVMWVPGLAILDSGKERLLTHASDALSYALETECGMYANSGYKQDYLA